MNIAAVLAHSQTVYDMDKRLQVWETCFYPQLCEHFPAEFMGQSLVLGHTEYIIKFDLWILVILCF